MVCYHWRIGVPFGRYGEPSTTGAAAPQSQPSLGCCPCVCTRAQSECRPTSVPPTSLCDLVVQNSASHPVSLAKVAPLGPIYGLAWSICLSRFARGRVPPCVRPSVDVSFFLVRSDKNAGDDVQSMVEKEILADSEISMTTAGSHSLLSCQCHDLYYPRDQAPMVGTLPVHERTAILIIVDSATAHRTPPDGSRRRTL